MTTLGGGANGLRRAASGEPDPGLDLPCRTVLFDCDGVLVDSTAGAEEAWRQWARLHGLEPSRVLAGVHGRRSRDTVLRFVPPTRLDAALDSIEALEIESARDTAPIPGARRLLDHPPTAWAVVTSASRSLATARLRAAGLPVPAVLITAEDVEHGKPAPDAYRLAAQRLNAPIGACTVVEDSVNGVRAALAARAAHVLGVGQSALNTDAEVVTRDLTGVRWAETGLRVSAASLLRPSTADAR